MSIVTVVGTIRDVNGKPYQGALVEAHLQSQMGYNTSLYGNEMVRTFSNAYGRFSFQLIPTSFDTERENYYVFKVVKDTINFYRKVINGTASPVDFESLPDFIPPGQRPPLLGSMGKPGQFNPITVPHQDLVGMFMWHIVEGNGEQAVFTVPGNVYFVALNGLMLSPNEDYIRRGANVIEFTYIPAVGDRVAIQYRI